MCRFIKKELGKKRGWCFFEEVDTPMHTMIYFKYTLKYTQNILHFNKALIHYFNRKYLQTLIYNEKRAYIFI